MSESVVVRCTNVERTFTLGEDVIVHAIRGIDMEIAEGEFVVVLGPSGSGKTTLLNQIGGIDQPSQGSIEVQGDEISSFSLTNLAQYRREKVGWIFQFFNLIPSLSAWENVGLALELADDTKDTKDRACKILEQVGLGDKVDRFPSQLSGGEQQRVAIARALVKKPTIVVADEPTGNLDWTTGQVIADLMKKMNEEWGLTFVVVSHDISITEHADRVYHLRDGRIVKVEGKDERQKNNSNNNGDPSRKKVTDD